jgi:hypothetical protein
MSFGCKWKNGDVIGFAVDMRSPGGAVMCVSVNGSFKPPNGVAFNIDARYLSPAFSAASGFYRVNFGVQPFSHSPPASGAGYVSVQEVARSNPSEQRKNCEDGVGLFLIRGACCSTTKLYKGLLAPDGKGEPRMCPSTMKFDAFNTYVADVCKTRRHYITAP